MGTVKHDVKINVFGHGKVGVLHVIDGIMEQVQYRDILTEAMLGYSSRITTRSIQPMQPKLGLWITVH